MKNVEFQFAFCMFTRGFASHSQNGGFLKWGYPQLSRLDNHGRTINMRGIRDITEMEGFYSKNSRLGFSTINQWPFQDPKMEVR